MDLFDTYRRSLAEFADRATQVRPDQWTQSTPCTDWDVRALVNHLVYEDRWSVPLFGGATIAEVGDRFEGDPLGDDPIGNASDALKQAEAAIVHDMKPAPRQRRGQRPGKPDPVRQ